MPSPPAFWEPHGSVEAASCSLPQAATLLTSTQMAKEGRDKKKDFPASDGGRVLCGCSEQAGMLLIIRRSKADHMGLFYWILVIVKKVCVKHGGESLSASIIAPQPVPP